MKNATQPRKFRSAHIRDVLRVLVARDFKLRYKRSILGIAWSLLVPLAELAVLFVVFKHIIRLEIPHYTSFLLAGILPWTWFQSSLLASSTTIVDNRELVRQVGFPVGVLPTVTVLSHLVHFLLALPILAVFLLVDGFRPGLSILALPLVIGLQFVLTVSLAYIVATLQVTFRDTRYLLGIVLFLFFYLTPVFWDKSLMPVQVQGIFALNPLATLLGAYRAIFMGGAWPAVVSLATLACVSAMTIGLGYVLFLRARDRFVEEL